MNFLLHCKCTTDSFLKYKNLNIFYYLIYMELNYGDNQKSYDNFMAFCKSVNWKNNQISGACYKCLNDTMTNNQCNLTVTDCNLYNMLFKYLNDLTIVPVLTKFSYIKTNIINNIFHNETTRNAFFDTFSKCQKHYLALNRFVYLYKLKKANVVCTTDLFLNELLKEKSNVIQILQNKKVFYFSVQDLMNIVIRALCKADAYFNLNTEIPCNPYTKEQFTSCHLYNLYFHIRFKTCIRIPVLFDKMFASGFCLNKLVLEYECLLKQTAIKMYVTNGSVDDGTLQSHIFEMLDIHPTIRKRLKICNSFPNAIFVNAFRSYVYIYYLLEYGELNNNRYKYFSRILKTALLDFVNYNPLFGRIVSANGSFKGENRPLVFSSDALYFNSNIF
jgi:hypothetical protein